MSVCVCDASTSISAEFGGIRDSCLDIYHIIVYLQVRLIWGVKIALRAGKLRASTMIHASWEGSFSRAPYKAQLNCHSQVLQARPGRRGKQRNKLHGNWKRQYIRAP